MGKIGEVFQGLKAKGEKALVLFVTAGDPGLDDLPRILDALAEGGADIIEVGLPFSDPIADGPTIQAASQRALDRGMTTAKVFAALKGHQGPPLVYMGYLNPILRMGMNDFALKAREAGAAATILCDVTPEEAEEWIKVSGQNDLDTVFLAAPTSTEGRLDEVCAHTTGFVYAVSRTGVTGAADNLPPEAVGLVSRLRSRTDLPICVGFGISTPGQVAELCKVADGVVIGSWLVDFLEKHWNGGEGRGALVEAVKSLKAATVS